MQNVCKTLYTIRQQQVEKANKKGQYGIMLVHKVCESDDKRRNIAGLFSKFFNVGNLIRKYQNNVLSVSTQKQETLLKENNQ